MVVTAIIALIGGLVGLVSGLLPSADTSNWWDGFSGVATHMADLNYFLPLSELFSFTLGFTMIFVALGPVKILLWLLSWLRGGGES